jgi:hypothetical protein
VTACPTTPLGRSACADVLRDGMAAIAAADGRGCEVTVSTAPPLVANPYGIKQYECPHGTTYWIEPTSEQMMEWARDGVE